MGQYRSYENTILSPHIYIYLMFYVNKGKMFWGVCISNVTSVRDILVFTVQNIGLHEII